MSWTVCPICSQKNPPGMHRCSACGADFDDPDVQALAGSAAAVPGSSLGAPGALSASRFLGMSLDGLIDGTAARRLAVAGALCVALGFLTPVSLDFDSLVPAWTAAGRGAGTAFAIYMPLLAVILALVAGWAPLAARARTGLLCAAGLAGLVSLPWGGDLAGAPSARLSVFMLFIPLAGGAVALRLASPTSQVARRALVAYAVLTVAALLVPMAKLGRLLPMELTFYLEPRSFHQTASVAGAFLKVMNRDPMVLFVSLMALVPLAALPAAVILAWPRPGGVWDRSSLPLRAVGWLLALYVPLTYALYAFNLTGVDFAGLVGTGHRVVAFDHFVKTTMVGRVRLALLGAGFSLWACLGSLSLLARFERQPAGEP